MATIAQIRADLVGSSAVFRTEMVAGARQANQSLLQIRSDIKATADSLLSLNRAAAGFVGFEAVKSGVTALLDAQKAVQQIHYSLVSATGSAGAADAAYAQIEKISDALGLSLQGAALGFSQLSAAASANGIAMKDQQALFEGVAKSSTVLHLSSEQSSSAILALSQMFSKGKIQAQELWLQLGQAIPGVVPRFQQAVMEMIQGTDLAGKSFQQLMQEGDLTVQRFLPALIQALNETGRGAEQAATGLNAELNRLSTAWFKLKSDLSGGLFSDVATASVRLLSQNLEHLASVAGVTGGILAARVVGTQLQRGASGLERYQQETRGAQMAAAAERDYASQVAATARAEAEAAVSAAKLQAQRLYSAEQELAERQQVIFAAQAQRDAAAATLERVRSAATLSANIRAEQEASAALAKAEATLANEERMVAGALARRAEAAELAVAADARMAAASEAVAAAAARVAASNQAAAVAAGEAGLAGALTKAGKSLGSFALSLVGGPWGLAIAAIGGVGYAIYSLQKQGEEWRKATEDQVKSLQGLREQLQAAAKDYGTLHAAMGLGQTIELYRQSSDSLQAQRSELEDLQRQAEALRAAIASRSGLAGSDGGAIANWFDQRRLDQINDRIKALQDQIGPTAEAVDGLGEKLGTNFTASVLAAKDALESFRLGGFAAAFSTFSEEVDAGIKSIDEARAKVQQLQGEMQADAASLSTAAATDGLSNVAKEQWKLQQAIAQIRAQHLSPQVESGQIQEISATGAAAIQAAAQKDAADAAKKAAAEAIAAARQQQEAYESVVRSITERIAQDKEAAGSEDKLTAAERLRVQVLNDISAGHLKLSPAQRAYVNELLSEAVAQGDATKAAQEHQKQLEAMAVVQDNIARIQQQYAQQNADDLAGLSRGGQYAQDAAALRQIQRQYDDLMSQAGKQLARKDITQDTYDQEIAKLQDALNQQLKAEQDYFAQRDALQADWQVGAQRALDQYNTEARDVASQTAQVFTDAFSGMEDAIIKFVQTGKLSFTDLANSIIADIVRMEVKAAASGIMGQLFSRFMPIVSGGESSAWMQQSINSDISGYSSDLSTFTISGARATGGPTEAGKLYEVAENGPELFQSGGRTYLLSGQNGQVQPASRSGAGSGVSAEAGLTVNIYNSQGDKVQATAKQSTGKNGLPQLDVFIDSIEKQIASNVAKGQGPLVPAMRARFNLNPAVNA